MTAPRKDAPRLSVVIAAWCNEALLTRCLESIHAQRDRAAMSMEIIVVTSLPAVTLERMCAAWPQVSGESLPGASVLQLRAAGAARARGDLVAFIEDHVTVGPAWAEALLHVHAAGRGIIGGPVVNGLVRRAFDWALYFVEYGVYMPPMLPGPVPAVSGVNVTYDRALLDGCRSVWQLGLSENEVNDALGVYGHMPYMAPDAWVAAHLPMSLSEAMTHLYQGGRHFAQYRAGKLSRTMRLAWLLASPAVPLVLFVRIARSVVARAPAHARHLVRGVAYFGLILGAWSVGELVGYANALRVEPTGERRA